MERLKVFISWSGERSLAVAQALKAWLPDVVRNTETWLSKEDLRKGLQWLPELNKHLADTGFGLVVLTADNKDAPWLVFEAGVISKALPDKHCCPLLCDLKQSDISGPLTNFQSTMITKKEDMLRLIKTMNEASDAAKVDDTRLDKWFSMTWDDFERHVAEALAPNPGTRTSSRPKPTERELLEEVLSTVRRAAIERPRPEDFARGLPLVVHPELLLREVSRLDPSLQEMLIEAIMRGPTTSPERFDEFMHYLRRRSRRPHTSAPNIVSAAKDTPPPPSSDKVKSDATATDAPKAPSPEK